ncbi:DUF1471 domain-containing protein [Entomohabitans teleogrylli]|uniref:DUF1471 domain-containing protein n=1 Tax=Entomohabitans teleogrylli TaxID=1384589 RepID=UPI00073D7DC7|nr:DUF1471 domain-containing protein [Entomohabitans teleogrylli]
MKRSLALTSLLLSVGLISTSARSAEEASADRVTGLNEIGIFSLSGVNGSPQDIERIVAFKADEHGASYYRIIQMRENTAEDHWNVKAIFYA